MRIESINQSKNRQMIGKMMDKNDREKLAVEFCSSERSLEESDWCQWRPPVIDINQSETRQIMIGVVQNNLLDSMNIFH